MKRKREDVRRHSLRFRPCTDVVVPNRDDLRALTSVPLGVISAQYFRRVLRGSRLFEHWKNQTPVVLNFGPDKPKAAIGLITHVEINHSVTVWCPPSTQPFIYHVAHIPAMTLPLLKSRKICEASVLGSSLSAAVNNDHNFRGWEITLHPWTENWKWRWHSVFQFCYQCGLKCNWCSGNHINIEICSGRDQTDEVDSVKKWTSHQVFTCYFEKCQPNFPQVLTEMIASFIPVLDPVTL